MPPKSRNSQVDKASDAPRCKLDVKVEMAIVAESSARYQRLQVAILRPHSLYLLYLYVEEHNRVVHE